MTDLSLPPAPPACFDEKALELARDLYRRNSSRQHADPSQSISAIQCAILDGMRYAVIHNDAETNARALQVSMERSRAAEWGEYLAVSADNLLDAINKLDELVMRDEEGEEVDESDLQHAREVRGEYMARVRGDVYNFRRKVEEGTARIDKHARPAEHAESTVATIRAFMDRPGETYRNGTQSLGIGFALALAKRINEARDELNELKIAATPNEFQAGAIMDAWHALAMTDRFKTVHISRDSLQILFDDFLSDKARRAAAAERRAEVKPLYEALEHIESTAKRSREQSRRIRWIALRARGGLDGSEDWRTVDLPKGTEASKHRMRREAEEAHAHTAEVSARFAAVERELAAYKEFAPAWSPAVSAILNERIRQITEEGFNADHDAKHREGELAKVAGYYALSCAWPHERDIGRGTVPTYFPWDRSWWKPKSKMRNLERAAALIIAELDRMMAGNVTPETQLATEPAMLPRHYEHRDTGALEQPL